MSDPVTTRTQPGEGSQPGVGGAITHPLGWIDPRDQPQPNGPGEPDPSSWQRPAPDMVSVERARPMRTAPALGRIVAAGTVEIPATQTGPQLAGLDPSTVQGHAIAYLVLFVEGGQVRVAGDASALPSSRCALPTTGAGVVLEHVAGLLVWGDQLGTITVSYMVVGV